MQDDACAMGRARCKGSQWDRRCGEQHRVYLPVGGSEVAREIALGHILGREHSMNFFLVFLLSCTPTPKHFS